MPEPLAEIPDEVLALLAALDKLTAAWEAQGLGCQCTPDQAKADGEKCAYCEADALLAFYDEEHDEPDTESFDSEPPDSQESETPS